MNNYELLNGVVDFNIGLQLGSEILDLIKTHTGELFFNDGINVHLNQEPQDFTENYAHISDTELCHIPIVENELIKIYKYQLIFTDMIYQVPVSLMLYKVFTTHKLDVQKTIISQLENHYNKNLSVLYTMGSKFGTHLPYHTDRFEWRYHQNLQFSGETALEFIDGEKVKLKTNQAYNITSPNMPHRLVVEKSNFERIFLSASPR